MAARELDIAEIVEILKRRGPATIAISLLVGAIGFAASFLLPKYYHSQAVLVVSTAETDLPINRPDMETWRDILLARDTIRKIIDKLAEQGIEINEPTEKVRRRLNAWLTTRVSRDTPYASSLNLTYEGRSPEECQDFVRTWTGMAIEIADEMARREIDRLSRHYERSHAMAQRRMDEAEKALVEFLGKTALHEEKVRVEALHKQLEEVDKKRGEALAEMRFKEASLQSLRGEFDAYFVDGEWVGELTPEARPIEASSLPASARQLLLARREYLSKTAELQRVRVEKRAEILKSRFESLNRNLAMLEERHAQETAQAQSLERSVAALERRRREDKQDMTISLRKAPPDAAYWLATPERRAEMSTQTLVSEEINPQYFEAAQALMRDTNERNKARGKAEALGGEIASLQTQREDVNRRLAEAEREVEALKLRIEGAKKAYENAREIFNDLSKEIAKAQLEWEASRTKFESYERGAREMMAEATELNKSIAANQSAESILRLHSDQANKVLEDVAQKHFLFASMDEGDIGLISVGSEASLPQKKIKPNRGKIALGAALVAFFLLFFNALLRESQARSKSHTA